MRKRSWQEWLISDAVLGSLVVIFTVATAYAAYQSSITEIEGADQDVNAQNALILATTIYMESSLQMSMDITMYNRYEYLKGDNPEVAAVIISQGSDQLHAGMEREGGPFDDIYEETIFKEAKSLLQEAQKLNEEGNIADDLAQQFQMAAFILAIGLAITAWASLFDTRPKLRLVFTLIAIPCLIGGVILLLVTLVT